MDAATGSSAADLEMIRESDGGPVCQQVEHPLPTLVLPEAAGRAMAKMATPPPPLRLIPQLLEKMRMEQLRIILVAPDRGSAVWYVELSPMVLTPPWPIPQFWGVLSQVPDAMQALPTLDQLLRAWLLKGTS